MRFIVLALFMVGFVSVSSGKELLYLGHSSEVKFLRKSGNYLLSFDVNNNWTLWNFGTKERIINGTANSRVDLRRSTMLIQQGNSVDLYRLPDTTAQAVPVYEQSAVNVSADGACFWSMSQSALNVWDRNGVIKLVLAGDYSLATVVADSANLYIAIRGQDSLRAYPVSSFQNPKTIRFAGGFVCWMAEGATFLSTQGGVVRVNNIDGTTQGLFDVVDVSGLDGSGSNFWTVSGYPATLKMYHVAAAGAPVLTMQFSNTSRAFYRGQNYLAITPVFSDTLIFCKLGAKPEVFTNAGLNFPSSGIDIDPSGEWAAGNSDGLILCGKAEDSTTFECFNHGLIRSITGTHDKRMAFSTTSGKILTYDFSSGAGVARDTIDYSASSIRMSLDGSKLFALQYTGYYEPAADTSKLTVFGSPDNRIVSQRVYPYSDTIQIVDDFSISNDGSVVGSTTGTLFYGQSMYAYQAEISSGTPESDIIIQNGHHNGVAQLSPSGRYAALQSDLLVKVYENRTLVNVFSGKLGGWFNDSSLIINTYRYVSGRMIMPALSWQSTGIFTVDGKLLPGFKCPEVMNDVRMISDSIAFYGSGDTSYSLTGAYPVFSTRVGYASYQTVRMANLKTGIVNATLFVPGQPHGTAFPVGPDYIVYQTQTALEWMAWHELTAVARPAPVKNKATMGTTRLSFEGKRIYADFTITSRESPEFSLFSLRGELMAKMSLGPCAPGSHRIEIPVSVLSGERHPAKVACVAMLRAGGAVAVEKLIW